MTETVGSLLLAIANHLLDRPEKVSIEVISQTSGVMVQLQVPGDEPGKTIGRGGRTASSLRCLLAALTEKTGTRFTLHIVEQSFEDPGVPPLRERMKLLLAPSPIGTRAARRPSAFFQFGPLSTHPVMGSE